MNPYIVVVETSIELSPRDVVIHTFADLESAWDFAVQENVAGRRAYAAAVLASPEVMLGLGEVPK